MRIKNKIKEKFPEFIIFIFWLKRVLYFTDTQKETKKIINVLKESRANNCEINDGIILMPIYDDFGTMKIIFEYQNKLFNDYLNQIRYYYVLSTVDTTFKIELSKGLLKWIFKVIHLIELWKISKIYNVNFNDIIASNFQFNPEKKLYYFKSKEDLLLYKYKDILIGDLIYDTFLRQRGKPTIDLTEPEVNRIFNFAHKLVDYWENTFLKFKIKMILQPYVSYIHWGIVSRIAINKKIDVILFGSSFYNLIKLNENYLYHTKNFNLYPKIFESLNDKSNRIIEAESKLDKRLKGDISEIRYMNKSAFQGNSNSDFNLESNLPKAVIFLHDFFDSPHCYGDLIFPDFYDWILYILNIAKSKKGILYLIKPHPNALEENEPIVRELQDKHQCENIIFLPKTLTNNDIIKFKPSAIFTVYGTVAHEFAYLGFPVVTAGRNPHSAYDFVHNPESINELEYFLSNVGKYFLPKNYSKEKILEFYYMHYLYYSKEYNSKNSNPFKDMNLGKVEIPKGSSIESLLFN
jgi:hypothetical protein